MKLKKMLSEGKSLTLLGVSQPIEAMMLEAAGFKAAYVSGAALSTSLGFLDEGLITLEKMIQVVSDIRKVSDISLLVDCDTGLLSEEGSVQTNQMSENDALPAMAHAMMHLLAYAGADAVQIEDQVPAKKRCGHLSGKELISMNDMFWKIRMLAHWRKNKDQLIVARTDARAAEGLEGAIFRAHRYINAGTDAIFPEALESEEEFRIFRENLPGIPLVANLAEDGKTPPLTADKLFSLGYQMVLIPATPLRLMLKFHELILKDAKYLGTLKYLIEFCGILSRNELNEFIKNNSKIYKKTD